MGEKIKKWLGRPIYIYLFGLFFLIYKTSLCFIFFDPLVFVFFLFGYCSINYIIILILKRLNLYKYGVLWILLLWICVLFTYPIVLTLENFINPVLIRFRYFLSIIVLLTFLIYQIKKRISPKKTRAINYVLNTFTLILTGSVLFSGLNSAIKEQKNYTNLQNKKAPSIEVKNKKDLIWILLDEYASPNSLKSQFNFHNPLTDSLSSKNFYIFNTIFSRNDTTIHSLSSLFNLDDSIPNQNFTYAANKLIHSLWIKKLKQDGYNFTNLDFLNIGAEPKFQHLRIFPDNYIDQILNETLIAGLWDKFKGNTMPFDNYNQNIIQKLPSILHQKHKQPNFLWIHLLIPHPPFYRDANGNLNKNPVDDPSKFPPSEVIKQYTGYVSYANKVVLNILNQIPDWKNKVIVISGDHGARMLIPPNDPRRKQPFAAIYYQGMDTTALSKIKYLQQIPFHLH
ncbi:sulfatase-like hydrolase/transferase [Pedobacter nutrimenti]|nr:sulfatase-like hydrolase/transferase [Pedobacter nutrimenti]